MISSRSLIKYYQAAKRSLLLMLMCFPAFVSTSQVRDAFKLRGPGGLQGDPNTCIFTLKGDFTMISNVNLWAASGSDTQTRVNNNTNMVRVDLDGNTSTSNSSMSELKLYSSCSKIVYAGLYWTARTANNVTDAAKKTIKIKGPGATTYTTLTTPMYSRIPGDNSQYVCFTDVTEYVKQRGAGQYWVADIALTEGSNSSIGNYAGWGMVVIYEDSALPMRNIAMFDGYAYVSSSTGKQTIPVSGFKSVQTGPVKVKLGFMAGEGDAGYDGDWCQMRKATAVGNVNNDNDWIHLENPTTAFSAQNFWRSRVIDNAGAARNPNYVNNLGFDAFVFTADNTNNQFIGNNQTSTAIRYGTDQDQYVIFNMTMAVDAYIPDPQVVSQVSYSGSYVDQAIVGPGEVMTYKIELSNQGNEAVLNTKIEIPVPFNATYVPGSINSIFDVSISGATVTYDPAGQKIVINIGTLPMGPTNDPGKILATITYQLKATTDCYYLMNSNPCLRNVDIQGSITGVGAITGVSVLKKTIAGFQGGGCAQAPITTPTTSNIVVPSSYTACDGWQSTTPNLKICPGGSSTITTTTVRNMLTLPSGITYIFNSAADGSGTVYNDNNPFPAVNGTYYAVPINTTNEQCSGAIPFTITILSVSTPPNVSVTSYTFCPADLPATLVATPTSTDYSIFWYSQSTGGNSVGGVTIPSNTAPGSYTYYVAQGYDALCQSARIPVTVIVNPTPATPTLNGSTTLCGGSEASYNIVSPNTNYTYEWALDNAPAGVTFKNATSVGAIVSLVGTDAITGTFTIKVRAKGNVTGCYGDYRNLSVVASPKPTTPVNITGSVDVCENSSGNIYSLSSITAGVSYEWAYSGTGYTWANGSNVGSSVELQFSTGATSGMLSVRAKSSTGCYSNPSTLPITVNPRPTAPVSVSVDNICVGQHAIIKVNNSGNLKYQVYSGTTPVGALTTGNNGTLSIDIGSIPTAGSYSYNVKSYNDKCYSVDQTSVPFNVLTVPSTPIVSPGVNTCYATMPTIQVLNATQNITYNVYTNVSLSGTPNTSVTAPSTSSLSITISDNPTANKTYYVTASNGVCASVATAVPVTVRAQIDAPVLSAASVCIGQRASIIISNAPLAGGAFNSSIYQYKVYSDAGGTTEIPLQGLPQQISATEMLITPNIPITANTTLYVRLIAFGCNGPISSVSIQIAPRSAPSVLSPVRQCIGTRALITIYNTVAGFHYKVYSQATGGTPIRDLPSPQSGDFSISLPSSTPWVDGTIFYVEESVRDESDVELCVSPRSPVTMESGTPPAPTFAFSPTYTCSGVTATLTIANALLNRRYTLYDTDSNVITTIEPPAYLPQYTFTIPLPAEFVSNGGSITYYMDVVEIGSTCYSDKTPITINLATPSTPTLGGGVSSIIVCRGTIPELLVSNAKQGVLYTVYDSNDVAITTPIEALSDGDFTIPIPGITLSGGETVNLYLLAEAPSYQNSCASEKMPFTLTDGEPIMPPVSNVAVCHGSPISIAIPSPVAGYTYLAYDQSNNLVGTSDGLGNITLNDPNILNPAYPNGFVDLSYYVKAQSATCTSESNANFTVRINRTAKFGEDFTATGTAICEGSNASVSVSILASKLINSTDLTLKWYDNSSLSTPVHTETYVSGTSNITHSFSGLAAGTYVYYLTVESASEGICPCKPHDAGVVTITVRPHAIFSDLTVLDTTICSDSPVTLTAELANSTIVNPIFSWYADYNNTSLLAYNTSTYTPIPNLTTSATYYVSVKGDNYCENRIGDDEIVVVTVNPVVQPPSVAIATNATAICSGSDLILELTPGGAVSGYELWEGGTPMPTSSYAVNMQNGTITVFAPSSGNHTYSVVAQLYSNSILCVSDPAAAVAQVSVVVNDPVAQPSITLAQPGICYDDATIINVSYVGPQPTSYILYSGTGIQDNSLYTVSGDMQTITLQQPVLGHHSYTLESRRTSNGITCSSLPSTPVATDKYPLPTADIVNVGSTNLCGGDQAQLRLDFSGTPPFTYTVQAIDVNNQVTYIAQNAVTNQATVMLTPTPSTSTVYVVTALQDNYCSAAVEGLYSFDEVMVYSNLEGGMLLANQSICYNSSPGDLNVTQAFGGNTASYQYAWQQWDGSSFVDILPAVATPNYDPGVLTTGTYRYQRTVTDGCQTKTAETTIIVRDNLSEGSLIASTSICNNSSPGDMSLSLPTGGDTSRYSYTWQLHDGSTFVDIVPDVTTSGYNPGNLNAGTYRYQRTVADGCHIRTAETTITVYSDLSSGSLIPTTSICLNGTPGELSQNLPSGGNTANYQYTWQKWNGSSFVDISPAVTTATYNPGVLNQVGVHRYQRTVTDGCQTKIAAVEVGVYSDLHPGSLVASKAICSSTSPGSLSALPADLCGGTANITYQWFTSNDGSSWSQVLGATNVDYDPGIFASGTYYYKRKASDGTIVAETSVCVVTVWSSLQAGSLISPIAICNSASPGELNVQLASGGNESSYSYSWQQSNDGVTYTDVVPTVTTATYVPSALTTGTHYFRRTVTDGCQTASVDVAISVYSDLQPGTLVDPISLCVGGATGSLSQSPATGGNTSSYLWQKWNGVAFVDVIPQTTTVDYNPGVLPVGNYVFRRTVTDGCRVVTADVEVGVFSDLNPGALVASKGICRGTSPGNLNNQPAVLCGGIGVITYQWYEGTDGVTWNPIAGGVNVDYNPGIMSNGGVYYYKREASDGTNKNFVTVVVTVYDELLPGVLFADKGICNRTAIGNLNLQGAIGGNPSTYTYSWQQSTDGVTFVNIVPAITTEDYDPGILSAGTYHYRRVVTDGCQTAYGQVSITVYSDLNGGSLISPMTIKSGTPLTSLSLTDPSGGNEDNYQYVWQVWDGTQYVDANSLNEPKDYGPGVLTKNVYRFRRMVYDGCQTAVAETEITVISDLNAGKLIDSRTICNDTSPGNLSEISPSGDVYTVSWQQWNGVSFVDIAGITTPDYNPGNLASGVYRYQRTVTNGTNTEVAETTIDVLSDPDIAVVPTVLGAKVSLGNPIDVTIVPSDYSEYIFIYGNDTVTQANNILQLYHWGAGKNNQMEVFVTDSYGCKNSKMVEFVGPLLDLPNVITPDNDGYNDRLLDGFDIEVFNRWGSRIYSGTNGWDGRYNGQYVATGTYYYIIHMKYPDGTTEDIKYHVLVKR